MGMSNEYAPVIGIEERHMRDRGHMSARQGVLGGPSMKARSGQLFHGLDFQLDSGHSEGDESLGGDLRVYEMDYIPPGRVAIRLARIYVTGDRPCHVMDRARGTWRAFAPATEYWYSSNEALAALVAGNRGGKLVFRIAHASCRSGTVLDEVVWDDGTTVVEQVAPRDAVWQTSAAEGAWPAGTHAFSLSSETPAPVRARRGCLVALRLTVSEETGADEQTRYRLSATEWYQDAGQGLLFTGWNAGEGVVLERTGARPAGSMQVARCALAPGLRPNAHSRTHR